MNDAPTHDGPLAERLAKRWMAGGFCQYGKGGAGRRRRSNRGLLESEGEW